MLKSELFLQLFFVLLTSALIALIAIRVVPNRFLSPHSVEASTLIDPAPLNLRIPLSIAPPTKISIPSIDLSLDISPGVIVNNQWTLFTDKISWLSTSSRIGEGNTILYGHNRIGLFGGLKKLSVGDEITIKQDDKPYKFKVWQIHKVLPTDVEAVLSNQNQLTLYTCDGSFDQRRLVVFALPK